MGFSYMSSWNWYFAGVRSILHVFSLGSWLKGKQLPGGIFPPINMKEVYYGKYNETGTWVDLASKDAGQNAYFIANSILVILSSDKMFIFIILSSYAVR